MKLLHVLTILIGVIVIVGLLVGAVAIIYWFQGVGYEECKPRQTPSDVPADCIKQEATK